MLICKFDAAKEAWDFLAERFKLRIYHYQHLSKLHSIRQKPGQSVEDVFVEMCFIWNELAHFEPKFKHADCAEKFIAYRDLERLYQFLIALHDDFDNIRTSILHRDPLPSLDRVVLELSHMEKHLPSAKLQKN
ncbi:glutamate receptor 2.7-like protein [Corchorus olitorius]|uniref:Glutamate receptor 2.7-like protein n=1 Tax=Corchorus olitorius TaxID=93759 RepID=A0A1R3KCE1_9ROSI|nr:glutamate receptor 2.7-like protein [Corchorus olitorius]